MTPYRVEEVRYVDLVIDTRFRSARHDGEPMPIEFEHNGTTYTLNNVPHNTAEVRVRVPA